MALLLAMLDIQPARWMAIEFSHHQNRRLFRVEADQWPARDIANGGTIVFACTRPEPADAWHATGIANGATSCENAPGVREGAAGKLYLA
jgi:hypothetical protein